MLRTSIELISSSRKSIPLSLRIHRHVFISSLFKSKNKRLENLVMILIVDHEAF